MGCSSVSSLCSKKSGSFLRVEVTWNNIKNGAIPRPLPKTDSVTLESVAPLLHNARLLRHLPKETHGLVAEVCTREEFAVGDVIVTQGDPSDCFFAIETGRCSVYVDDVFQETWKRGCDFGEGALLHDEPRLQTVIAKTAVKALKITRARFQEVNLHCHLRIEGRRAITSTMEVEGREATPKTEDEAALIAKALERNENLQAMVTLDTKRVEQMVAVAWKEHVKAGVAVVKVGELAQCFYVVQSGLLHVTSTDAHGDRDIGSSNNHMSTATNGFGVSSSVSRIASSDVIRTTSSDSLVRSDNDDLPQRTTSSGSLCSPSPRAGNNKHIRRRYVRETFGSGDSFGELALLYSAPRFATVTAKTDSVLWGIDRKHFKEVLMGLEEEHIKLYVRYLDEVGLLEPLLRVEKERLAHALVRMNFAKGDYIVEQGETNSTCFLLVEGDVTICKKGEENAISMWPRFEDSCRAVSCARCIPSLGRGGGRRHRKYAEVLLESALLDSDAPCDVSIRVTSGTCKVVALLRDSLEMLIGKLDPHSLAETRRLREQERHSWRWAVHNVNVKKFLAFCQEPQSHRQEYRKNEIPLRSLKRVSVLGSGAFANVERWCGSDGAVYALKILAKQYIVENNMQQCVTNERNVLLMADSPFIIRLYEVYVDKASIRFLLEFAGGGDLKTVYNRCDFYGSAKHARYYAAGVVCAFVHLHSRHIIYRDLKPENLLVNDEGWPKLADMGLAKFTIGETFTMCGTPDYIAPEIIHGRGYSKEADWWSLGVFIYELMAGSPPFQADSDQKRLYKITKGISRVRFPLACQGPVEDLIRALLQSEPADRMRVALQEDHMECLTSHT